MIFLRAAKALQHLGGLLVQIHVDHLLAGRNIRLIDDEIARCDSSSSPTGVSSETGSWAIPHHFRIFWTAFPCAPRVRRWSVRVQFLYHAARRAISLLIVSIMWTGMRMVRA